METVRGRIINIMTRGVRAHNKFVCGQTREIHTHIKYLLFFLRLRATTRVYYGSVTDNEYRK